MLAVHRSLCGAPLRPLLRSSAPAKSLAAIGPSVRSFSASSAVAQQYPLHASFSHIGRHRLPVNTGVLFVPQQEAWVVERMGKYLATLEPGLRFLIPVLDRVKYVQSLKEIAMEIPSQSAITADNVVLDIDGVLYIRVTDPYKSSYGVENAEFAVKQLAQTTMRSEIGQLALDHVLKERQDLNANITAAINDAAEAWGVQCLRYEIRDIHPPDRVVEAMQAQVTAEREKRASILSSEAVRQSAINIAEGRRQSTILASEATRAENINKAEGEARAILLKANATSEGLRMVARAIKSNGGQEAVAMDVAEKYVDAFGKLAKEGNSVIVPAALGDMGGMIAQALSIYKQVNKTHGGRPSGAQSSDTRSHDRLASFTPMPGPSLDDEYFEGSLPPTSGAPLSEESISDLLKDSDEVKDTSTPFDDLPLEERTPPAGPKDDYVPGDSTIRGRPR